MHAFVEPTSLDWSSAKVREGVLKVDLRGERPKGWSQTFAATATMLGGGGDWDEVELKKDQVRVTGVSPGMEEKLRHFLESVVQQANADHRPEEEDEDEERREDEEEQDSGDDSDSDLTARFRNFAD
jgi:hypothetical protein